MHQVNLPLSEIATILRNSTLFTGSTDDYPLVEKQALFLAACGSKPVSEATSGHWIPTADGRRTVPDDENAISTLLDSIGLVYRLRRDNHGTTALVSRQYALLSEYFEAQDADDVAVIGRLLGYPISATSAYIAEESLDADTQAKIEDNAGLTFFPSFAFSRAAWAEELAVVKQWHAFLRENDLT